MRGHNELVKQGNLEYVENLKSKLIKISLGNDSYKENNNDYEELCLQQFLTYRLLDKSFSEEILKSIKDGKKLNITLPYKWREFLDKDGFKVNTFQNKLNWASFELFYFFYGLSFGLIEFFNSFFRKKILKNYVYLYDLNERNFPRSKDEIETNNFVNWFIKSGYTKNNERIVHSAKIRFNKIRGVELTKSMGPIPPLEDLVGFIFILVSWNVFCRFSKSKNEDFVKGKSFAKNFTTLSKKTWRMLTTFQALGQYLSLYGHMKLKS